MNIMRGEVRRIGANYIRLIAGAICGLLTTRLLIEISLDLFNLYTLVIVGVGAGAVLREYIRATVTPRLARAKTESHEALQREFSSCISFSAIVSFVGASLLILLAANVNTLNLGALEIRDAQVFIALRAAFVALTIFLTPILSYLAISGRFEKSNSLIFFERFADFLAILLVYFYMSNSKIGEVALYFSLTSTIILYVYYSYNIYILLNEDSNKIKLLYNIKFSKLKNIFLKSIFVLIYVISMNLFLRFDTIFINYNFGLEITTAFGISVQLNGYLRQFSASLSNNLDAVIAKSISSNIGLDESKKIISLNIYAQTISNFIILSFIILNIDDLLQIWIGKESIKSDILEVSKFFIIVSTVAISGRAFSASPIMALQATSRNKALAFTMAIAALINISTLLFLASFFKSNLQYTYVIYLYSGIFFFIHCLIIPALFIRLFSYNPARIYRPQIISLFLFGLTIGIGLLIQPQIAQFSQVVRLVLNSVLVLALFASGIIFEFRQQITRKFIAKGK